MDLNRLLSTSLRAGVLAGAFLSLLGLVLWAASGFDATVFNPSPDVYRAIVSGGLTGIVYLGVIVLIATPVFRVALSVAYFAVRKDKKYVGITILVFAMLLYSLLSGRA